jgi:hypothetical protein
MKTLGDILNEYFSKRNDGGAHFNIKSYDDLEHFESFLFESGYINNFDRTKLNELLESSNIPYIVTEGKYPERQAYNADGLLVTFPTPEYKQRAIARGTHFEKNPKAGQAAPIFQQPTQQTQSTTPAPAQQQQVQPQPDTKLEPADLILQPSTEEKPLETEPEEEKDVRTPEEKKQDAQVVQNILSSAPASIDITKNYPNLEENSLKFTLEEAKNNNFYEKEGNWYDSDGKYVGKKWICETTGKTFISK